MKPWVNGPHSRPPVWTKNSRAKLLHFENYIEIIYRIEMSRNFQK